MQSTRSIVRSNTRHRNSASLTSRAFPLVIVVGLVIVGAFLSVPKSHSLLLDTATRHGLPETNRLQAILAGPGNYINSVLSTERPEVLVLDIKFKHMEKIRATRAEALKVNVLNTSSEDFVPATIRHLDRNIQVKLRLKGDNTDHLEGDKWSFLVKVSGDDQLFGMRRFSLMNPRVRADQLEPMAYALLRKLGFLTPRYFFINLVVNGRRMGIMALEEYPTKELLESQGRRESVIVRFDESQSWDDLAHKGYLVEYFDNYATAPIKTSELGKVLGSEKLTKDREIAMGLLKGQVRGVLPASQVFNAKEYGRYLAALEILNASNGFWWGNARFYYNPISARLEPIASDLMSDSKIWPTTNWLYAMDQFQSRALLADPVIKDAFVQEIHRLAKQVEDGSMEEFLKPLDRKFRAVLSRDLPFLEPYDFASLKRHAKKLSSVSAENLDYFNLLGKHGHAYLLHAQEIKTEQNGTLELTNIIPAPVEIISISWRHGPDESTLPFDSATPMESPPILNATATDSIPEITTIPFIYPPEYNELSQIEIVARIYGTQKTYLKTASKNFSPLKQGPIQSNTLTETLDRHPFLHQVGHSTLRVQSGSHLIAETISTPRNFELQIPAGTTLLFAPEASLIVRGPLNITGTADNPVVLDGQEATEPGVSAGWRGLVVLDAKDASAWSHARIRNTTGVTHGSWELTGGVTFYESKVRLDSVTFDGNRAEDALNIVRSEFEIKDIEIRDTASDGFDSDFSHGHVDGGLFENIGLAGGGDGIDISGSNVEVTGTQFRNIDDKALSVGERSNMTVTDIRIDGALTGAASKDASRLEISSSTISNVEIAGLMAYVKKPEYGPASIHTVDVTFSENVSNALVQDGSEIRINGEVVQSTALNVDLLYESFMAKASRL